MYGFFECSECNRKWESARVYRKGKTGKYWGQKCQSCNTMNQPYRVEETECSLCGQKAKFCDCDKTHHTDPEKHHLSHLCEKCLSGIPCDEGDDFN